MERMTVKRPDGSRSSDEGGEMMEDNTRILLAEFEELKRRKEELERKIREATNCPYCTWQTKEPPFGFMEFLIDEQFENPFFEHGALTTDVYINADSKEIRLVLGDIVLSKKIKYCPVCGREL